HPQLRAPPIYALFPYTTLFRSQDYQTRVSEPALYGEVSYLFTDALKATVGLRGYQIRTETGGYLEGLAFGGARLTDPQASFTERSEEHTSELQSPDQLVCRLLL